ncbi:hypothetical protein WH47_09467 [Habropoda laboriosa]|uniref:Uncharacterized protein n=1 Tax=Habropoda laboriosa TaxID=597456 RepID=A0A0L7QIW4_9HYME|nr:hypothetical protein WH47_09467 [Habropoda laboriosa]
MKVSDKVYKDACYKDFVESGLAIAEYAENNRITVDFVNSIIKHGRSTVSLYSVHEAFQNIEKLKLFEIINDDDYLNNYLTVEGYADLNFLEYKDAEFIINKGREIYRESLPKNIELIKLGHLMENLLDSLKNDSLLNSVGLRELDLDNLESGDIDLFNLPYSIDQDGEKVVYFDQWQLWLKHCIMTSDFYYHEVTSDFIIEAIETFFEMRVENNPDWLSEARFSLKDQLLEFIGECGVGENTPSMIVDNFLINGDFISRADTECPDNEAWEEYCNEHAIIYNYEYACLQF